MALCAGVGGLELGLRIALGPTYRTVCWVERDPHAVAVLVARMRDGCLVPAPIWDDVTTFDGRPWAGLVDLIASGFPCQPWSVAGKRRGTADERWLWPEIARVIREVGPRYVFLENVPALSRGGLEHVLGSLAEGGYDAVWDLFRASDAGAPHRRERLFLLAYRAGQPGWVPGLARGCVDVAYGYSERQLQSEGTEREQWQRSRHGGEELADSLSTRRPGTKPRPPQHAGSEPEPGGGALVDAECFDGREEPDEPEPVSPPFTWPPGPSGDWSGVGPGLEPAVCGVDDGFPLVLEQRVNRLRCLGNAVVPTVAALAWRTLVKLLEELAGGEPGGRR